MLKSKESFISAFGDGGTSAIEGNGCLESGAHGEEAGSKGREMLPASFEGIRSLFPYITFDSQGR